MSIYYTPRKVLAIIDCKEKPQLAKELLAHDPNMVSNMVNITYELVEGLVRDSITYIDKMGMFNFATNGDRARVLELAYSMDKRSKKAIMEFITYATTADHNDWYWMRNKSKEQTDVGNLKGLFERIMSDYPEYAVATPYSEMNKVYTKLGGKYKNLVSRLDMKRVVDKIHNVKVKLSNNRDSVFSIMQTRLFQSTWFGQKARGFELVSDVDEHIEKLMVARPDDADLHAALLLAKL
jgi:isocitrate lyase